MMQADCLEAVAPPCAYVVTFIVNRSFAALNVVYSGGNSDVVVASFGGAIDGSDEGEY
jgi:hypothetical protein